MSFTELIATYGLGAIAMLAFTVNIVVELTKHIGVLKKMPTSAYTTVVSLIITTLAYFAVIGHFNLVLIWYELVFMIFGGFIVAYVAMYGWSKFRDIWLRYKR